MPYRPHLSRHRLPPRLAAAIVFGLVLGSVLPVRGQGVSIPVGTTDLILGLEGLLDGGDRGLVDSVTALEAALVANARSVHVVASADFDTLGLDVSAIDNVWVLTGTYPNDYRPTATELDLLATWNAAGVGLFFEGADHWGFNHLDSSLDARDGVGLSDDGDNTFQSMVAVTGNAVVDLSATFPNVLPYTQDQARSDWTDQLAPEPADTDVVLVEVVFAQSAFGYAGTVFTAHTTGAPMIAQSWEFGGFSTSQRTVLAAEYLALLATVGAGPAVPFFIRGDCNADGGIDLADAIHLLEGLFLVGSAPPVCPAACDVNDDDIVNIADAIHELGVLFPTGAAPPIPAPNSCGIDPTAPATGALPCPQFMPCP